MPRPAHWTAEYAARFREEDVAELYPLRLPHPPASLDFLLELMAKFYLQIQQKLRV